MRYASRLFVVVLLCGMALADPPPLVNFQGRLTDVAGVPVADGSYDLRFRIYSAATGDEGDLCAGTCLWEENQSVTTQSGTYAVLLGSVTPLTASVFDDAEQYMGIRIGAAAEMAPRRRVASVPYALVAQRAITGTEMTVVHSDPFVSLAGVWSLCGDVTNPSETLRVQHSVGMSTDCPGKYSSQAQLVAPGTSLRDGAVEFDLDNHGYQQGSNNEFRIGFGSFHVSIGGRNSDEQHVSLNGPSGILYNLEPFPLAPSASSLSPGRYEFSVSGDIIRFRAIQGTTWLDVQAIDPTPTAPSPLTIFVNEDIVTIDNLILTSP